MKFTDIRTGGLPLLMLARLRRYGSRTWTPTNSGTGTS